MCDDRIQACVDKIEIREVLSRYSICADTGDAPGFAAVFTQDGVLEWEAVGLRFRGRPALRRVAEAVYKYAKGGQHAVGNSIIRVDGDRAHSICQLACFLSRPEQIYTLMLGFYEDDLVRDRDEWLISRRVVRIENPEVLAQGRIAEYFAPLAGALREFTSPA